MAKMTGGEALAQTLKAAGVEYIFGISVGSQAPFTLGAMRLGMQIVTVRDEKCAALMATAYSKISGKPGICLASGPGAAHLALGMYEAFNASNAMVAITSDASVAGHVAARQHVYGPAGVVPAPHQVDGACRIAGDASQHYQKGARSRHDGNPGPVAVIVSNSFICGGGRFPDPDGSRERPASGVPCGPWSRSG